MKGGTLLKSDAGNLWVVIFPAYIPELLDLPAGNYIAAMRFIENGDGTETNLITLFNMDEAHRTLFADVDIDAGELLSLEGKEVTLDADSPLIVRVTDAAGRKEALWRWKLAYEMVRGHPLGPVSTTRVARPEEV